MSAIHLFIQQQTISLNSTFNLKTRHNWPTASSPIPSQPISTAQPKLGTAVAITPIGHKAFS